jgi:signal recognition particle receptor subunit beta
MPYVDSSSGELVMRIVYDGCPEAGKTTNIAWLTSSIALQRRGAVASPGTTGRRTEYFDWLDFAGGYIDGRRVRCQLVSVPGQPHLLHRRRHLLEAADAVVYVADARPEYVEEDKRNIERCLSLLAAVEGSVPIGLLVQGNKQDLPGALPAADLAVQLGLAADVTVVPSVGTTGDGIMQTFILATRLATDRVRAMLLEDALPGAVGLTTPTELYEEMLKLEGAGNSLPPTAAACAAPVALPNNCASDFSLGAGVELNAGDVWPPVKGRGLLGRAEADRATVPALLAPWAPADAVELCTATGASLHTSARWSFEDEANARSALLSLVKRETAWRELRCEGRALFTLCDDGARWSVWVLTPPVVTLAEELTRQLRDRDLDAVRRTVKAAARFEERVGELAHGYTFTASELCVVQSSLHIVALEVAGSRALPSAEPLVTQLGVLASSEAARDLELSEWLKAHPGLFD